MSRERENQHGGRRQHEGQPDSQSSHQSQPQQGGGAKPGQQQQQSLHPNVHDRDEAARTNRGGSER